MISRWRYKGIIKEQDYKFKTIVWEDSENISDSSNSVSNEKSSFILQSINSFSPKNIQKFKNKYEKGGKVNNTVNPTSLWSLKQDNKHTQLHKKSSI